ncbi:ankyrin repeat domain-containing protein [Chromobacterium sp. IIBBL 290-4]|uniref:ankyrin repeat domain-containing protein n=1 Tax=Chromobacterium sp. IIBBL 290-4 TaxID=2953890 RepID=UPI0020B79D18|nr:ankyrin repeat domain-containing protein [Chromobacterium sp. IIBBL 290-4]UTH74228.1 ankyrin repeat domain-containing protein [Chromobacterium sp. IIBBL 290-4]
MRKITECLLGGILVAALSGCEVLAGEVQCAGRPLGQAYQQDLATRLAKAVAAGDVEEVLRQIRGGADPNHLEDGAVPVLMWAICSDQPKTFQVLLENGADPNLRGRGDGLGSGKGHGLKEDLTVIDDGFSAMELAAGTADPAFLKQALKHGGAPNSDRNLERPRPNAPLLLAAYYGLFDNIKILLAAGADIHVHESINLSSSAPVLAIGVRGRFDIALWLLEHGYQYRLQELGRAAEGSMVSEEQQPWKEKTIQALRARGVVFPCSYLLLNALKERDIPQSAIEDLIMGRKSLYDFPEKNTAGGGSGAVAD